MKYLVIYSYYETKRSKNHLKFFINNGIYNNDEVDYIFMLNGGCSVNIPKQKNIAKIRKPNIGYDFGSWNEGLKKVNINLYNYFIFLNDTVKGPFSSEEENDFLWYKSFTRLLNDRVKLSGISINNYPFLKKNSGQKIKRERYRFRHVQSMIFCLDRVGLNILLKKKIFGLPLKYYDDICKKKRKFIIRFEIGMSLVIRSSGYLIASLHNNNKCGEIWRKNMKFGDLKNKLIFVKVK